jgi:hypothetical protein
VGAGPGPVMCLVAGWLNVVTKRGEGLVQGRQRFGGDECWEAWRSYARLAAAHTARGTGSLATPPRFRVPNHVVCPALEVPIEWLI